jgi:hypothetical protein
MCKCERGEEQEIEGGWTRTGWRESETDCERKGGYRGKGWYGDINILMGDIK